MDASIFSPIAHFRTMAVSSIHGTGSQKAARDSSPKRYVGLDQRIQPGLQRSFYVDPRTLTCDCVIAQVSNFLYRNATQMDRTVMQSRFSILWRRSNTSGPTRDVLAALALKGVLLAAIYLLFFGPAHRSPSDAAITAKALVGESQSKDVP